MTDQPIEHPSSDDRPPAANQASHADDPSSGAPHPTGTRYRDADAPADDGDVDDTDDGDDADSR